MTDASHFQVTLEGDPGADATTSSDSTVTEKRWESFLTWRDVVDGEITGVDLIPLKEDVGKRIRTYVQEHAPSYPGIEVSDEYLRAYPNGRPRGSHPGSRRSHLGRTARDQALQGVRER